MVWPATVWTVATAYSPEIIILPSYELKEMLLIASGAISSLPATVDDA